MAEMSPGTALRDLQKAQAGMKKARELLKQARVEPASSGYDLRGRLGEFDRGATG